MPLIYGEALKRAARRRSETSDSAIQPSTCVDVRILRRLSHGKGQQLGLRKVRQVAGLSERNYDRGEN